MFLTFYFLICSVNCRLLGLLKEFLFYFDLIFITTLALSICKVNVSGLLLSDIHRSKDLILDELRPVSALLLSDIH